MPAFEMFCNHLTFNILCLLITILSSYVFAPDIHEKCLNVLRIVNHLGMIHQQREGHLLHNFQGDLHNLYPEHIRRLSSCVTIDAINGSGPDFFCSLCLPFSKLNSDSLMKTMIKQTSCST